jgi:acyl-CoA dehydrogenase
MSLQELREHGPSAERELAALGGRAVALNAEGDVARRVAWARQAEQIAFVSDGRMHVAARSEVTIEPGVNLAGEERDTVRFAGTSAETSDEDPDGLLTRSALVRAVLMAGALERINQIALDHARQRRQFGRPIAFFQAVQAHLVTIAQQAALVGIATDAAMACEAPFEIAAAKLLANRAAVIAGRAAHQVLGARGVTREHPLSLETRRLWSWRSECGDERYWSQRLGNAAQQAGADRLYPAITAGSAELEV